MGRKRIVLVSRSVCDCSMRLRSDNGSGKPAGRNARLNSQKSAPGSLTKSNAAGGGRTSILVASLVDTNILIYRFDRSSPRKRAIATELLRQGIAGETVRVPHQAIVEFVSAVTRSRPDRPALLSPQEAFTEAEGMVDQFHILYPNSGLVRIALRGAALYQLPWYDAHLWAYAEHYGLSEIISENFTHGRRYGTVKVVNPFV
jgi:predicted nucleic acid-binding protein